MSELAASAAGDEPSSRRAVLEEKGGIRHLSERAIKPLLTVAMLFFCFHLWRLGDVNITISDTMFILVVVIEVGLGRLNGRPFGALTPIWLASLLLMITGLFIGSYFRGDLIRWLIVASQYLFSYMLLPMVLIRDRTMLQRMVVWLIIGVTAMETIGIVAYYTFPDYTQANAIFGPDFIGGNGRLGAMIGEGNWNGAEIAMTLPFVMYAASKRLIPTTAAVLAICILIWALLLAASFTGFCAGMLAMAAMAAAAGVRPSPKVLMLAGVLVLGFYASGYQMPDIFAKRVGTALETGDLEDAGTYEGRADLIAEAWGKAEQNVIIGMGVDQYRKYSVWQQPVHNMYMLQLSEGGILALAGWIALAVTLILIPLPGLPRHRLEGALSFSTIMVFQVFAMASPHMFARFWMVPVLVSLGILLTAETLPIGGRALPLKGKAAVPGMH